MRFPSLDAWLTWQEGLHPKPVDLGLDRVAGVWSRLRPEGLPFPAIVVGGTNGKGSCVAMLEAMLLAAGYRVGCYTSPHLDRYNERVRIGGLAVEDAALCEAFERVDRVRGGVSLTYFEFGTLAALEIFSATPLDLVVLEVGLGGRLDAVNIVDADVAVVTTIGLDHTEWLGSTLEQIAEEKAGVFRRGRPAVIGRAIPHLRRCAEQRGAQPYSLEREFGWGAAPGGWAWRGPSRRREALPLPALRGRHQIDNAAVAIMALECLGAELPVAQSAIRAGLETVRLPGRFQVIPGQPRVVLDVAHNVQGAESLAENLRELGGSGDLLAVFGLLSDKDAVGMARSLADRVHAWLVARPDSPRGMPAETLVLRLREAGVQGPVEPFPSVTSALGTAMARAAPGDTVLVFGSFVTVGEALSHLRAG